MTIVSYRPGDAHNAIITAPEISLSEDLEIMMPTILLASCPLPQQGFCTYCELSMWFISGKSGSTTNILILSLLHTRIAV